MVVKGRCSIQGTPGVMQSHVVTEPHSLSRYVMPLPLGPLLLPLPVCVLSSIWAGRTPPRPRELGQIPLCAE